MIEEWYTMQSKDYTANLKVHVFFKIVSRIIDLEKFLRTPFRTSTSFEHQRYFDVPFHVDSGIKEVI